MEYGLIGAKLGHSYSKIIHEMLLPQYPYELHPLPTEAEARQFLEQRPFQAINVTIPYKRAVMNYLDELSGAKPCSFWVPAAPTTPWPPSAAARARPKFSP